MVPSKVFFTDFRTPINGEPIPDKLKRLILNAGIKNIDMDGRFVAIKMHFGEWGNVSFLRPNYVRAVVEVVKSLGGKPFLTDCNTLYPGFRKNALEHLECAWRNGFAPYAVDCPIIIGDGLKGTDEVDVPVRNGEYVKKAHIGRAIMDADVFISLSHFKGHEETGFGGALKNIGMGCGSRAGKKDQHSGGKARINAERCRGCRRCESLCANGGLVYDAQSRKMQVSAQCVGCGRCVGGCNFDAISFSDNFANHQLGRRIAEYSQAVVDGRPHFHISLIMDVSPNCDCHCENDAPIIPNIGMFASFDPVALDQACADACNRVCPIENSQVGDHLKDKDFEDRHDVFLNSRPTIDWQSCLDQAEKIGLGSRNYELVEI